MSNMQVALLTAGYGNAIFHGNSQAATNFNNLLQEQIESMDEVPPNIARWGSLKNGITYFDLSDIGTRVHFDNFLNDFELNAYVKQLAMENGIKLEERNKQIEFAYQITELLSEGKISRQDIIDAVKYPPQYTINDTGGSATINMEGFGINMKNLKLTSAMELFEALWGK